MRRICEPLRKERGDGAREDHPQTYHSEDPSQEPELIDQRTPSQLVAHESGACINVDVALDLHPVILVANHAQIGQNNVMNIHS